MYIRKIKAIKRQYGFSIAFNYDNAVALGLDENHRYRNQLDSVLKQMTDTLWTSTLQSFTNPILREKFTFRLSQVGLSSIWNERELQNIDWESEVKKVNEDTAIDEVAVKEAEGIFQSFLSSESDWEQDVKNKFDVMVKKHPLFFLLLFFLITSLGDNFIGHIISNAGSIIRKEPNAASETVSRIPENTVVIINEETKYYINITYGDNDTGNLESGWAAKRNIGELNPEDTSEVYRTIDIYHLKAY